ncbi:MAG TPA: non-oxidative hydroxyarylic acid decarboxylases subunit D [Pseudonocardia sp.]|uniref:non-oxidative hydroxyarylic acid decarboxylases subunit D n=1 Tax=Pseudonocardia sp. TaxID=60912 RepID=UPI002CE9B7C8|nr:non-oxidative hydroxyarylic acid decarboxylases subunit D [Pseudonocardia sp.]HTF46601.1 non-oxidative hydroxyarylic acid decarboxylases subunit D [Pseudonocardia sp.]
MSESVSVSEPLSEPADCPRCSGRGLERLAVSPVPGSWSVWSCPRCWYSWRSTEPKVNSSPAHYPAEFRLTELDIAAAQNVPAIRGRETG